MSGGHDHESAHDNNELPNWIEIPEPDLAMIEQMLQDKKVQSAQSNFIEYRINHYEYENYTWCHKRNDEFVEHMIALEDY